MARYTTREVTHFDVIDTTTGLTYRSYDSEQSALAVAEALNDLEVAESSTETMVIDATQDVVEDQAEPNGYYG